MGGFVSCLINKIKLFQFQIKRSLCWPFDSLRAGLKLIVSHGELVEPRIVASVPRRRGQGVVAAAVASLI
ncbi:MAG: hypothetical protein HGB33_02705 [Syntrophaceae bacterium]|nr:hypothetical protein [Syntrophaceae bacterium]